MTDLRQAAVRALVKARGGATILNNDWRDADAVLAEIRTIIGEDVRKACKAAFEPAPLGGIKIRAHEFSGTAIGLHDGAVDKLLDAWMPIIALAARDAALEEAAKWLKERALEFGGSNPSVTALTMRGIANDLADEMARPEIRRPRPWVR